MTAVRRPPDVLDTDVLVIGGGIAGAMAAIRATEFASRVTLVDKAFFGRGGCSALASGVFHFCPPDMTPEAWIRARGGNRADQRLNVKLGAVTYELLHKMDDWGVKWIKHDNVIRTVVGTGGKPEAMLEEGGPQMMLALRAEALRRNVRVINRVQMTELLTSDGLRPSAGGVVGAVGLDVRTAEPHVVRARSTIVCTGPTHFPYPRTPVLHGMPIDLSGDGVAAMLRAGAVLSRMSGGGNALTPAEFYNAPGLEMFTALDVKLVNRDGEDIRSSLRADQRGSAYRTALSHVAAYEIRRTKSPIFLDARGLTPDQMVLLRNVLPIVVGNYEAAGYNLSRDLIPYLSVTTGSAAIGGNGARVNERGETSIPGLYAAGNASDGAYSASTATLAESAVMGWWAGEHAGRFATSPPDDAADSVREQAEVVIAALRAPLERGGGDRPYQALHQAVERLLLDIGVFLDAARLRRAREQLDELRATASLTGASDARELAKLTGLRNFMQVLDAVLRIVEHRQESRGSVLRLDYPYMDNESWLTWTFIQQREDGQVTVWDEPIPEESFVLPPARKKIPHPVARSVLTR